MRSVKNEGQGNRIKILDQLRGLALLAIFLVNISGLASIEKENQSSINESIDTLMSILLEDSARPLFAFMFGISIILIYERLSKKNLNPFPTLFRRLLLLFIVGALHGYYIWAGDILLMYAMAGYVLLFFIKFSEKWLLTMALFFWLGYTIGVDFLNFFFPHSFSLDEWLKDLLLGPGESPTGSEYLINEFSSMVEHLGFFLFGMYTYRKGLLSQAIARRKRMWLLSLIFLTVGVSGKTALYYEVDTLVFTPLENFYPFVVTVGILMSIILLGTSRTTTLSNALLPFTAVGKMAFTNYLLQSLVFVSLFMHSGRTIFERVGIWMEPSYVFALFIGIILFVVQMIFSHLWLKTFYYGPFEWFWRMGTYGKKVPLRRKT
ncbi:uncharacterized protein HNR44_001771 [Geomicrobium halophilum]|uniref:DUF418 domain-containing protein n=1 Tax=Geomicrobium halophilum TaxID=549000 RepID=A0A841PYM3_9BACL|nr:DUF418 domain-containing protein [Geomicrobium halophilum]MBB6449793.1 uncharacterized protein [Geomicrobium halophilum]